MAELMSLARVVAHLFAASPSARVLLTSAQDVNAKLIEHFAKACNLQT